MPSSPERPRASPASLRLGVVAIDDAIEALSKQPPLPGGDERSSAAFQMLASRKEEIEASFGGALDWQELPGRHGCRICTDLPGGWKSPEADWPDMQDRMIEALIRLENALRKPVQELNV